MGVTLYHLLTGKSPNEPPYEFKPLRTIDKSFSEGIEFIVNKCVQSDPSKRYQDVNELLYDLNNIYTFNSYYKKQKLLNNIKLGCKCGCLVLCLAFVFISGKSILNERIERYRGIVDGGYYYLNLCNFPDARAYFDEAIKMEKNNPEPYLGIAQILLKQGRYDECVSYIEEIATKMPESRASSQYNYLTGSVYYEQGKYDEALKYLEIAYNADPEKNEYARDAAVCYAKLGELSRAREILNSIPSDGVTDDVHNYVRGQVILADGNRLEAIQIFENVISITENEDLKFRSYMELSNIYKAMRHENSGDWAAINAQINVLERAVKDLKDEDNLIVTEAMAEVYFTAQRYELSIEKFKRLIELGYERAYIYSNIAIIYHQMENFSSAEEILLIMKDKYPDNYQCYVRLAYLYMDMEGKEDMNNRNYSRVLEHYNLAVQFAPSGMNTSDIIQLTAKINELRSKGWL